MSLTRLLEDQAVKQRVPGVAVGLLADGEVTTAYAGVADVRTKEPVTRATRFAIGSLTKSMVATVIAALADSGRLSLDKTIDEYVPEVRGAEWSSEATVRALLANRSSLPLRADWEFTGLDGDDDGILSRFASVLASGEGHGPAWSYTNAGWCLLGRLIERVTERVWEEAMRSELLTPLGMEQTTFANSPFVEPRATGHEATEGDPRPVDAWTARAFAPAGTSMLSTVDDLLRFAMWHLEEPSLSTLREPQAEVAIHAWLDAWGLGWARFDWEGGSVWGWDGLISGQRAILRLVPNRRGAVVLLTNGNTGRALYRALFPELMDQCFGIRMPPLNLQPAAKTPGDLRRFAGIYAWPDRRWLVSATADRLLIEGSGRAMEAVPIDSRVFLIDPNDPDTPTITFGDFDVDGRPSVLYRMLWGYPRVDEST